MRLKLAVALILVLSMGWFAAGCASVPEGGKAADDSSAGASTPPFANAKNGIAPTHTLVPNEVTIPAGTAISVRLQNTVSSTSNRAGDEFMAVLDDAIVVGECTVAPRGAAVKGRVVAARSSGRLHNSGYLRLSLLSIVMNGKAVPVHTSNVFAMGGAHKKRNLALIGGGAGAGAVIGAIAGGGKGALIGSAIGAGAGTTGAYATGKKDVSIAPERRLTFRLTEPVVSKM